jgi:DNA-directed RNA polymerase specialized sigma subunit
VSRRRDDGLTPDQWALVQEALPRAHKLADSLARRCHNHTKGELRALAEDSLARRVRRFDATRGKKLFDFARDGVRLDLIRAASQRAHDPCVASGLRAMDRHEEAIEHPDLGARVAESLEEKDARARALGDGQMAAARCAQTALRAARTQEDELGARQEWDQMLRDAEAVAEGAGELLVLLYKEELTWDETGKRLGIDERTAQRLEAKVIAHLRALYLGRLQRNK